MHGPAAALGGGGHLLRQRHHHLKASISISSGNSTENDSTRSISSMHSDNSTNSNIGSSMNIIVGITHLLLLCKVVHVVL